MMVTISSLVASLLFFLSSLWCTSEVLAERTLTSNQQNLRANTGAGSNREKLPNHHNRVHGDGISGGAIGGHHHQSIHHGSSGNHNKRTGAMGGASSGSGNSGTGGISATKVKLSSNQTVSYSYGVELPSFAFDYSEYITGATITRSSSKVSDHYTKDLNLMIFLLGHRAIYEDFPFEAISTEFEFINAWQKAIKHWPKERVKTEKHRSSMYCVIQNNHGHHHGSRHANKPYMVPAQWLHISIPSASSEDSTSGRNTSNFNKHIDVLRCKLKNTHSIYSTAATDIDYHSGVANISSVASGPLTPSSNAAARRGKRIFVDLIRKEQPQSKADSAQQSQSLVISFNIPWEERQMGYPSIHHQRIGIFDHHTETVSTTGDSNLNSRLDMWYGTGVANSSFAVDSVIEGQGSTGGGKRGSRLRKGHQNQQADGGELVTTTTVNLMKVVACVSGIRPLQTPRPEVSIPMIIEYVESLLAQGVEHIVLGIQLHYDSFFFYKYRALLSVYIEQRQVLTLISTAMTMTANEEEMINQQQRSNGERVILDDVAGYSGVQLQDEFADLFFVNQCLASMKGMAEFVLISRINQFIFPMETLSSSLDGSNVLYENLRSTIRNTKKSASLDKVQNGYTAFYQALSPDESLPSGSSAHVASQRHGSISGSTSMSLLSESSIDDKVLPSCSIRINFIYGVADPEDSFAPWGPGDTKWIHDFYRTSPGKLLKHSQVRFFSTRHTAAIDVDSYGNFLPICYAFGDTALQAIPVELTLSSDQYVGVHYKESHSAESIADVVKDFPKKAIEDHFQSVAQGIGKSFSFKDVTGSNSKLFFDQLKSISEAVKKRYDELESAAGLKAALKDRREIKPPFWQPCNTEHLAEVMDRVFPGK